MPISVERDDARRRTTIVMTGVVSLEDLRVFARTSSLLGGDDLVADLRNVSLGFLSSANTREIAGIAEQSAPAGGYGRVAIVVGTTADFGTARMYATHRSARGLLIEVFRTMEDDEGWLEPD